jgi:hypothetical protein
MWQTVVQAKLFIHPCASPSRWRGQEVTTRGMTSAMRPGAKPSSLRL